MKEEIIKKIKNLATKSLMICSEKEMNIEELSSEVHKLQRQILKLEFILLQENLNPIHLSEPLEKSLREPQNFPNFNAPKRSRTEIFNSSQEKANEKNSEFSNDVFPKPSKSDIDPKNSVQSNKPVLPKEITSNISEFPVFVKKEKKKKKKEAKDTAPISPKVQKNLNDVLGKGLKIGLNDKIAIINHLFNNSYEDYRKVLSNINTYDNYEEVMNYLDAEVKPLFDNWNDKNEHLQRFYEILENNF